MQTLERFPTPTEHPAKRLYTLEEFFAMGEAGLFNGQRVELIDGEVIVLPSQGKAHSQAVRRLTERLVLQLHTKAFVSTHCPLILDGVGKIYVEPDLALLELPQERYDEKMVEPSDTLLVIEVSDSTLKEDRQEKLKIYARNGIREYWIFNVEAKQLEVYRAPEGQTLRLETTLDAGQPLAPLEFPDVEIRWW
jgi:Uma2 family endonuclease